MFAGTHTALVTPFRNDRFDEAAFTSLIEAQIAGGITGIVPVGTTGESPTLDHTEHLRVIELAVQVAKKRTLVIAGTGSNSTREAVEMQRASHCDPGQQRGTGARPRIDECTEPAGRGEVVAA